jgi:PadR family transcriptional regulator, regulatory protein PadR
METNRLEVLTDFDECPCTGGTLDKLVQPAILVVLTEGPSHGYRLVERVGEMSLSGGQKPNASGVYRVLKQMEARGLVASSWIFSESGPAKRSYQLTSTGEDCLKHWIETLTAYRDGISSLLRAARKAVDVDH